MRPAPRYEDYGERDTYERAWYSWRALEREHRLTDAERTAKLEAMEWWIEKRTSHSGVS